MGMNRNETNHGTKGEAMEKTTEENIKVTFNKTESGYRIIMRDLDANEVVAVRNYPEDKKEAALAYYSKIS
jgi:hypothetical protein